MRKTVGRLLAVSLLGGIVFGSAQLPPEILADQYLLQADQQIAKNDHEEALQSLQKILALQKEHGLTLPEAFHFKYAQVAFAAGSFPTALESVNQYLVMAGRDGEFYQKALELLLAIKAVADRTPCAGQPKGTECWLELASQPGCSVWIPQFEPYKAATWTGECSGGVAQGRGTLKWVWEAGDKLYKEKKSVEKAETPNAPQLRSGTPSTFRDGPTCAGQPNGTACWMELADQPGCYVWDSDLNVDATVTWTGECIEGIGQGTGTFKSVWDGGKKTSENTGRMQAGKKHGQWVLRRENGDVFQGPYVEGKFHGPWILRLADGTVQEGSFMEGKHYGQWVLRYKDGDVEQGSAVEGKRHGQWLWRDKDGSVEERFYVEGKKIGSNANAEVMEGLMVNGQMHGDWVWREADGDVEEGPYVEGQRHGQWVLRFASGNVWEGPYVSGKKQGSWVEGNWKGAYAEDRKHGDWVKLHKNGNISEEVPFVKGKRQGRWVSRNEDGSVFAEGTYVADQKHGRWLDRYEEAAGSYWDKGSGSYVEGKRHGRWSWQDGAGDSAIGPYVEGKEHGFWTFYDKDSKIGEPPAEGPYEEGQRHGRWVLRDKNGTISEGPYVKGKRHGTWLLYSKGKKDNSLTSKLIYDSGSIAPVPLKPEMAVIPAGEYRRGCRLDCGEYSAAEKPVRKVRVEAFELSRYEVTFEEYDRYTAATGRERADDEGWGRGRQPVINVSWEDAVAYASWLSEQTGQRYRLPSEAEWEYAARSGTKKKKYSWGNEIGRNRANCRGCGSQWGKQTAPVGSFPPNRWGLHDMHGNVWEWVQDCWNGSYQGAPADGTAWASGDCSQRVLRGGSWYVSPRLLRSANRIRITTTNRYYDDGFRVARTITP